MGFKVVLTGDRTIISDYNGLLFFGYISSLPKGFPPDWFYYKFLCPSTKTDNIGRLQKASYGIRKIEAALLHNGFKREDVIVAHPEHLDKVVDEDTKIVAISSFDPLGIGPVTNTFKQIWGGEGKMAGKLRTLVNHESIKKYKPTIVLGGSGAWQFEEFKEKQEELGIDIVIIGEGDITGPQVFKEIIENGKETLPPRIFGEPDSKLNSNDISEPSLIGLIEVTRGCARSCAFCEPTLKKVISRPLENILKEVKTNLDSGNGGAFLHSEDILLYESDGLAVNHNAVVNLFQSVKNFDGVRWVGASHVSFSSALSSPKTVEKISEILELGTSNAPIGYFQVGIETGSVKLIRQHMKGKVFPYQPEEWPDVVRKGWKLLHENNFALATTIILGLPGEEQQDVNDTIDLVKSLRNYRGLIVPLLFSPMANTNLQYSKIFKKENLTTKHYELLLACWRHNINWMPDIHKSYARHANSFMKLGFRVFIFFANVYLDFFALRHEIKESK